MPEPHDRTPPLVLAMQWSSRITTISLEMVVPGLIGYWLDQRLRTGFLLLTLGIAIGLTTGIMSLVRIARQPPDDHPNE
ncbi:MAG: AtpZ/AtpI family protein [Thermoguttaceae bacterium]